MPLSLAQWLAGLLAIAAGAVGFAISLHYPLYPYLVAGLFVILGGVFFRYPIAWLFLLPAAIPLIGFAPWSGWVVLEEVDLLVLATAAGGYLRLAWHGNASAAVTRGGAKSSAPVWMLALLFVASTLLAMERGFDDAGGFAFGWFQGYHEPMNSVRLAKSFLLALLLLPLWHGIHRERREQAVSALFKGLLAGLAGASLAALWERLAFPGLLNFSADYRTTGLFWEMHVGGAALDGFLALTVPFAVREMVVAKSLLRGGLATVICALAGYTCLTTFSRGVYVAVPVGLLVYFTLAARNNLSQGVRPWAPLIVGLLLVTAFAFSAAWMFEGSGYRGMAALLGSVALMLWLVPVLRGFKASQWWLGGATGVVLILAAGAVAWALPKGAYVAWILMAALTVVVLVFQWRVPTTGSLIGPLALGGFLATLSSTALVANHWGESVGLQHALPPLLGVLAVGMVATLWQKPLWQQAVRWQLSTVGAMAMVTAVVGVMGGGVYMSDRFSTGSQDLTGRLKHWQMGRDMLSTPADWWLGKGLGRFADNYFLQGNPTQRPGDFRIATEANEQFLTMVGGLHMLGYGELLRVMQRVPEVGHPIRVNAQVRAAMPVRIRFEVCEKHLLYPDDCQARDVDIKGSAGKWQTIDVALAGPTVSRGAWFAPKFLAFSAALSTNGGRVNLDRIRLSGADGRDLLTNGDFSDGMAHWFFTSDKHHMPWHIKSMFMHVFFDQGLVGLALWGLLVGGALVRLTIGKARHHPLAPALAAGLVGFMVVGVFDSLLDVPRVALLFYLMVLLGLTLRAQSAGNQSSEVPVAATAGKADIKTSVRRPNRIPMTRNAKILLWVMVTGLLLAGGIGLLAKASGRSPMELAQVTPAEWLRHAKPWLHEHDTLGAALLPPLELWQKSIERPPPTAPLPTLGKGQQTISLPALRYTLAGVPIAYDGAPQTTQAVLASQTVASASELIRALEDAQAGQLIEVAPGRYRISRPVATRNGGTAALPITLRGSKPGEVVIELDTEEGFHVTQPYWVFENLTVRGVCQRDTDCDHAFHVVGPARGVVLRNNRVEDFNAHIKVNGTNGQWPDAGLVQFNTLTNNHSRKTARPVTPFDLVAASDWQVADNVVTDFVHAGGDQISYGVYMKGAGAGGRIERNLIVCTSKDISQAGNRVGISWGGGGTNAGACRDKVCVAEHSGGVAANNVVAHCNDVGLDVNMSMHTTLAHNTLVNTAGILVRGKSEVVNIYGNLLDGRIRDKNGIGVTERLNNVVSLHNVLEDADRLNMKWKNAVGPNTDTPMLEQVSTDFCNQPRQNLTWTGANGNMAYCSFTKKMN